MHLKISRETGTVDTGNSCYCLLFMINLLLCVADDSWQTTVFTARAYARAVLGVVILSVRPSVTRVDCDKSK